MAFTANGQSYMYNNNMIDGMDNNQRSMGSTAVEPSLDALQEVKVETSLYSAEYSRTGGGIANLITKSGSNQFHGSLFEFMRNDAFDSYGWGSNGIKSKLRQNQYGGSFGGPILKNKAFFFGDYQGWRQVNGSIVKNWTLTPAEYESVHNFVAGSATSIVLNDQWGDGGTATTLTIPSDQISSLGVAYLMTAPKPTCDTTCSDGNYNYRGASDTVQNADTYDARVDYHFDSKNTLFGRYSYNNTKTTTPYGWPASEIVKGVSKTYFPANTNPIVNANLALDFVHIFSPTTLFEGKASYLRSNSVATTVNKNWSLDDVGIPCSTDFCYNTSDVYGLPKLWLSTVGGTPGVTPHFGTQAPYNFNGDGGLMGYIENTFQYMASLTLNRNTHSIKIGATLIRRQINAPSSSSAQLTFAGAYSGNVLGDMLLGYPVVMNDAKSMAAVQHLRMWEPSAYIQDDWRLTSKLTLNLGVRYDVYTAWTETQAHISNFDLNTDYIVSPSLAGEHGSGPTAGVKTDYGDIAPRLGFAYSLPYSMVLRGGWGMSYFPGSVGGQNSYFMNNSPFYWSASCGDSSYASGVAACNSAAGQAILATEPNGASDTSYYWLDNDGNSMTAYNMKYGFPRAVYSTESATDPYNYASAGLLGGGYVTPHFKSSYLMQYNLQLQKQYKNHILTVGYVGNQGRRIPTQQNLNQPIDYRKIYPMNTASTPWMDTVSVPMAMSAANSAWEAGEATYQWNSSHGFNTNINFTWARTEAQGTGITKCVLYGCPMDNGSGTAVPVNGWKEYNYDGSTSHRAAGTVSYNIPFGKSLRGPLGAIVKGWALNGTGYWNTGAWTAITSSLNYSGITAGSAGGGPGGSASEYPNRVSGVSVKPKHQSLANWVNPDAFKRNADNMLGNAHNSVVQQPRTRNVDLGLGKTFAVWENMKLQFRADAFNFTNTPSYSGGSGGGPGGPGGPGGGGGTYSISSYDADTGVATNSNGFGSITSGSGLRIFQFGLKLTY